MSDEMNTDVETRSAVDLRKAGAARYFEDETTDVLLAAFQLPDGRELLWDRTQDCPDDVAHHIRSGGIVPCFNAMFEYLAFKHVLHPRYGFPMPRIEQMSDTMAWAAAMSIPQSLDGAAQAMGLANQKDKDGQRLIRKFSMPRKAKKGEVPGRLYWNEPADHPEDFHKFGVYCIGDTRVEKELREKCVPLSDYEQRVWEFTARMNLLGAHIDRRLVEALLDVTEQAKEVLDRRMARATGFEITACSQVAALTNWLKMQGVPAEKLNKNAIEDLLATELPDAARDAVEIRKEAAKTSTAKLVAMRDYMGTDGRVRGMFLYHGAGTGRWAGRGPQPQNFPRGTYTIKDAEAAVDDFLLGNAAWIDLTYGLPMSAVSDMLRSCITASPGNRLLAADYSSIESRVIAWLAGEQWKIDAFVAYDEGRGPGMYELMGSRIFSKPPEKVTKDERQASKSTELGCGFQGGVLAFHTMAKIYGVDMAPALPKLIEVSGPEAYERAVERYADCLERGDTGTDMLSRDAWVASEMIKNMWRAQNPAIVALWAGMEEAALDAVRSPGGIATYRHSSFLMRRGFLWQRLPSGRCLAYGAPKIENRETPWGTTKESLTALGVNSVTKRWERFSLYGGQLAQHSTQATARDLMANGMLQAEVAGYPIVMTIHDEAVADVPTGQGTLAEFERLLCDLPGWAGGLPVVASGWEGFRYRKD
jgi:DNA polymerase